MLDVNNVEVVYHDVVLVLRGVSLEVGEGRAVALLGPNGAGKTTLMRAITGLLDVHNGKVTKGKVTWQGRDITTSQPDEIIRGGISQVMERRRIFPDLTIEENLLTGAYTRSARSEVRHDLEAQYERFPILGERRDRTAGYLSGGEQQMLAISRALMSRPRMLLLDEPSLGLAPKITEQVAEEVKKLNGEGISVLVVEQNAGVALDIADHGYILENGKIVHEGSSRELLEDEDIKEFYLGAGEGRAGSLREVKHYRRRKRWLS